MLTLCLKCNITIIYFKLLLATNLNLVLFICCTLQYLKFKYYIYFFSLVMLESKYKEEYVKVL